MFAVISFKSSSSLRDWSIFWVLILVFSFGGHSQPKTNKQTNRVWMPEKDNTASMDLPDTVPIPHAVHESSGHREQHHAPDFSLGIPIAELYLFFLPRYPISIFLWRITLGFNCFSLNPLLPFTLHTQSNRQLSLLQYKGDKGSSIARPRPGSVHPSLPSNCAILQLGLSLVPSLNLLFFQVK